MTFPESELAHDFLNGLKGIEIGASAHNPFGLDTINVDITDKVEDRYKQMEIDECGEYAKVDVVADGAKLPFKDKEFDFVISSHVIEHFFDPIGALMEWKRVASKYIFLIVPHKNRTFDKNKPLTTVQELLDRHAGKIAQPPEQPKDDHWSIWTTDSFLEMCNTVGLRVVTFMDIDDKAGNGFTIVIDVKEVS